jgi:hypothetical protein
VSGWRLNKPARGTFFFLEVPEKGLWVITTLAKQILAMAVKLFEDQIRAHR